MEEHLQLVRGVSPMEVQRFETLFKLFDEDGSGSISIRELADLMPRLGIFPSEEELHELFEATDADQSGDVDFSEFLNLMARQREENQLALLGRNRESFVRLKNSAMNVHIMAPDGVATSLWECIILMTILFYVVTILIEDVLWDFEVDIKQRIVPALIFFADVILRGGVISYLQDGDFVISHQPAIIRAYSSSTQFYFDIIAALPIDLILADYHTERVVLQHIRLVKLTRVAGMFPVVGRELITPSYTFMHFSFFPILKMCFWAMVVVHTLTIIWLGLKDDGSYIDAVYFVMYTLTTTGYGDIAVETDSQKIFASFLFCCATLISGLVVGKLVKVSEQADLVSDTQTKMLETLAVMEHLCIPHDFAEEILAQQYHRLQNSFSIYSDAIDNLPQAMRDRMMLYARMKVVTRVPMFSSVHEICLAKLAQALVSVVVPPDEYIIIAGEEGVEMYFLFHGTCDVWLANGTWIAYVKKGGVFGEIALLKKTRRAASIISLTYCQLFRLDKASFDTISFEFPELYENVQAVAEKRVKHPDPEKKQSTSSVETDEDECAHVYDPSEPGEEPHQALKRKSTTLMGSSGGASNSLNRRKSGSPEQGSPASSQEGTNEDRVSEVEMREEALLGLPPVPQPPPQSLAYEMVGGKDARPIDAHAHPHAHAHDMLTGQEDMILSVKIDTSGLSKQDNKQQTDKHLPRRRAMSRSRRPSTVTPHYVPNPKLEQGVETITTEVKALNERLELLEMGLSEVLRRLPSKDNDNFLQTRQVLVRNKASARSPLGKPGGQSPLKKELLGKDKERPASPTGKDREAPRTFPSDGKLDRPSTPTPPTTPLSTAGKITSVLQRQIQDFDSPSRRLHGLHPSMSFDEGPSRFKRNLSFNMKAQ